MFEVSVVIPTLNGADLIESCITSFIRTVDSVEYELIVVDDGSIPEEKEKMRILAAQYSFKLIELPFRHSYARAVNRGIEAASGKYLLLLNNDVIFQYTGWLTNMLQTMNDAWNIGIVGCRLLYSDYSIQHAGGVLLTGERYEHLYKGREGDLPQASLTYDVEAVTGALMLIKKEVIDQLGLLSEDYLLSYEDVDFCLRARQSGWRVVYCGNAVAIHDEGSTRGRNRAEKPDEWFEEEMRSYITFWTRWRDDVLVAPLINLTLLFVLNRGYYLPSYQRITNLIAGLREQGCQVELSMADHLSADSDDGFLFTKINKIECGVLFTNDRVIAEEMKKRGCIHLPILCIDPSQWHRSPYPQDVYMWLNLASKYIKGKSRT